MYGLSICMCGAQAGYVHDHRCPYPLFRGSAEREAAWFAAYQVNLAAMPSDQPSAPASPPASGNGSH